MSEQCHGVYSESEHGLTVTARILPGDECRANLCLAGEIDIASSAVLSRTVAWLTAVAPASVLVDLSEVTFACSTLPNFAVRVRQLMPDGAELILWQARPTTEWVLRLTGMETIATITPRNVTVGAAR